MLSQCQFGQKAPKNTTHGWKFTIIYKINNGSLVAFRKAIAINDLPNGVLNLPINEIVSVTDDEIIFEIGAVKITSERPRGHSLK
jgi:hypothetical protein